MSENKLNLTLKSEKFRLYFVIGGITAIGLVLRLYTISKKSLWMDELRQTSYYYSSSLTHLIERAASQNQPPLDYFIGYLLAFFFDGSELLYRFPAMIFGTLIIILTFCITKELFTPKIAILASFFTALSKVLVEYSQEARPYSLFIFLLLLSLWLLLRALSNGDLRHWLLFGISLYLMLISRVLLPIVALYTLNILFLSAGILNYFMKNKSVFFKGENVAKILLTSLLAFIAYYPFFYIIKSASGSLSSRSISFSSMTTTLKHFSIDIMIEHFIRLTYPLTWLYLFFLLSALVFALIKVKKKPLVLFFTLFVLMLPFVQVFVMNELNLRMYLRYSVYYLPFLYILVSAGIVYTSHIPDKFVKPLWKISSVLIIFFSLFIALISINSLRNYYFIQDKTDWRGASQHLMNILGDKDVILTESFHEYGTWEPGFIGRWFYFNSINEDYNIDGLTNYLFSNPETKGNLVLLLFMNFQGSKKPPIVSDQLEVREFTGLNIITLKEPSKLLMENYWVMYSELLRFMPEDSSRVDLYLNAARWPIASSNVKEAEAYFSKAKKLVQNHMEKRLDSKLEYYRRYLYKDLDTGIVR
ncbi:MAG: glycosyltransferase family 39 protein [Deltaproteobacteria bacterium]|nr:glycosyltransferase family 39 protein [Deltaproteobacteria bacterium]